MKLLAGTCIAIQIFFGLGVPQAAAAEIKPFSAIAVRAVINEVMPAFEKTSGHKVTIKFDVNPNVKKQIEAGETFDVVLVNPEFVDELTRLGKVAQGSGQSFGRIGMGVGIKAGAPKPDLSNVAAFKSSLLAAKSVAYAGEGSSGVYFIALLEKLGISAAMKDKLKPVGGGLTGQLVAKGDYELGVVPVTTILAASGAELAGYFPSELQSYIDFGVGISATTKEADASKALLAFLRSAEIDAVLKKRGVDRMK
jgi:molybdate transport system substrate-binding protein